MPPVRPHPTTTLPFIAPHDRIVAAHAGVPDRWAFVCHGILGSRRNWRSFARRLVDAHPDLGVITVDLRNHGDSPPTDGPHTLAACAADLGALAHHLGIQPAVLIGHSFGGKVVLQRASELPPCLEQVWVLDSRPEPMTAQEVQDSDVRQVISTLKRLPRKYAKRDDVVRIFSDQGFSRTLALWMTTNLRRQPGDGYVWRFDLDGVIAMITDYYRSDLREVLTLPVPNLQVHVVRAENSHRWPASVLQWFHQLPAGAPGRLHLLPDSGHWVHVDNPDGLLDLMDAEL